MIIHSLIIIIPIIFTAVNAVMSDNRTLGLAVSVGGGIVLFLVILLALIYLRL